MENGKYNPWLQLWTEPRKTIRSILTTDPQKLIIWLAVAGGIVSLISYAAYNPSRATTPLTLGIYFVLLAIVGGIFGLIHLYFSGWLLKVTGQWVRGKGSFTDVKCAVGWSNYPFIISNLFALLNFLFLDHLWIRSIFLVGSFVLSFWAFIIFLKLIGEAHQFSAWKALLAFIIYTVLILAVLVIIALLVPLLSPLFH